MKNNSIDDNVTIIVADDDEGSYVLINLFLRRSGLKNKIIRFFNGEETLNYLFNENHSSEEKYLILLDIRMPKVDGITVLEEIKKSEKYSDIPVLMVTTSYDPQNVERCKQLGCDEYIVKPIDTVFVEKVKQYLMAS